VRLFTKAIAALILGAILPGCVTFDRQSRDQFVGEWIYADKMQSCRYSFRADGSFHGEVSLNGTTISRFTGRWTMKDEALLYTYLGDTFGRIPVGTTDRDQLLQVHQDWFLIRAANGERRRYRRIR
jgi:hypothetical protein